MKRELKALSFAFIPALAISAAAQIPMKRELKVFSVLHPCSACSCCSPNPYEEGTERDIA